MIFKKLTKIIFVGLFEIADLCFFTDINITIFNNNAILQKKKKNSLAYKSNKLSNYFSLLLENVFNFFSF